MDFLCRKCRGRGFYLQEKGPNVGIYCDSCGSWNKWVSKKELPMMRRNGFSVLPCNAVITLKNNMNIGVEKVDAIRDIGVNLDNMPFGGYSAAPEPKPVFSEKDIAVEVERRVAERLKELEKSQKVVEKEEVSVVKNEQNINEGFCPICEGNPLESEGNSRVEVSIFSGVMTITDPEGLNIYGLYKLKRCPFCGKLF